MQLWHIDLSYCYFSLTMTGITFIVSFFFKAFPAQKGYHRAMYFHVFVYCQCIPMRHFDIHLMIQGFIWTSKDLLNNAHWWGWMHLHQSFSSVSRRAVKKALLCKKTTQDGLKFCRKCIYWRAQDCWSYFLLLVGLTHHGIEIFDLLPDNSQILNLTKNQWGTLRKWVDEKKITNCEQLRAQMQPECISIS